MWQYQIFPKWYGENVWELFSKIQTIQNIGVQSYTTRLLIDLDLHGFYPKYFNSDDLEEFDLDIVLT